MGKSIDEIQTSYMYLLDTFTEGLLTFILYRGLIRRFKDNPTEEEDDIFIYTVTIALIKTIILMLGNHLQNNKDSLTLIHLENIVRNSKKEFEPGKYESILASFKKMTEATSQKQKLIERIVTYRNQIVAHVDRIRVNNPKELIDRERLNITDMEELVTLIGGLLYEIGPNLGLSPSAQDLTTIANVNLERRAFSVYDFIKDSNEQGKWDKLF